MRRCGAAAWSARSSSFSRSPAHLSQGATAMPTNDDALFERTFVFRAPSPTPSATGSCSGGRLRRSADLETTSTSYRTGHSMNLARSSARSSPRTPCSPHGEREGREGCEGSTSSTPPHAETVSSAMSLAASGTGAARTAANRSAGGASASSNTSSSLRTPPPRLRPPLDDRRRLPFETRRRSRSSALVASLSRDAATSRDSPPPAVLTRNISHRSTKIRSAYTSHSTFDAESNSECAGALAQLHKNTLCVSSISPKSTTSVGAGAWSGAQRLDVGCNTASRTSLQWNLQSLSRSRLALFESGAATRG